MIKLNINTFKKRFPQFGEALDANELQSLIELLKIQLVEASEALIVEGTETNALYFIWEGQLDVMLNGPEGEHKVASVESGDLLGEISLLSPNKTTATIRSQLGCIALHLDVESLETFWDKYPHAASKFLQILSRIVAQRTRNVVEMLESLQNDQSTDSDLSDAQETLLKG